MDATMPLLNGMQATRQILLIAPATKVVMLSAHSEEAYVTEAVNSRRGGLPAQRVIRRLPLLGVARGVQRKKILQSNDSSSTS